MLNTPDVITIAREQFDDIFLGDIVTIKIINYDDSITLYIDCIVIDWNDYSFTVELGNNA